MGITFFNDGIIEASSAEAGNSNAFDAAQWTIGNIHIQEGLLWKAMRKNELRHTHCIPSPDRELKLLPPLLRHGD